MKAPQKSNTLKSSLKASSHPQSARKVVESVKSSHDYLRPDEPMERQRTCTSVTFHMTDKSQRPPTLKGTKESSNSMESSYLKLKHATSDAMSMAVSLQPRLRITQTFIRRKTTARSSQKAFKVPF